VLYARLRITSRYKVNSPEVCSKIRVSQIPVIYGKVPLLAPRDAPRVPAKKTPLGIVITILGQDMVDTYWHSSLAVVSPCQDKLTLCKEKEKTVRILL